MSTVEKMLHILLLKLWRTASFLLKTSVEPRLNYGDFFVPAIRQRGHPANAANGHIPNS